MMKEARNIEMLYEMGQLRLIKRMWRRFFQSETANITEHTFRVIWLALLIAKKEKVRNEEKIMKMALVHDITESRTGDVDYISRQYAEMKEELAIKDILVDTVFEKDFMPIWKEYEDRKSVESKIVKDADTLDCDMELMEQGIQAASDKFIKSRNKIVKPKLYTKTAKHCWDLIYKLDADGWHVHGRNRFNAGDWSNKDNKNNYGVGNKKIARTC